MLSWLAVTMITDVLEEGLLTLVHGYRGCITSEVGKQSIVSAQGVQHLTASRGKRRIEASARINLAFRDTPVIGFLQDPTWWTLESGSHWGPISSRDT